MLCYSHAEPSVLRSHMFGKQPHIRHNALLVIARRFVPSATTFRSGKPKLTIPPYW